MGNLFSKQKSKRARSSAAQTQKGTVIRNKLNITAPATPSELRVATSELLHDRQQIILCTWQTAGLTLDQGGVRLSTWKGQSEAVTEYHHNLGQPDYVNPQIRTKAHKILTDICLCSRLIFQVLMSLTFDASVDTGIYAMASSVGREEHDPLITIL